jgi:hypothetical protein
VASHNVAITQSGEACSYALSTSSLNLAATATSGTITAVPSPADCPSPVATSNSSWASAAVWGSTTYWSVTANTGSVARSATLTIAGKAVTIQQSASQ